MLRNENVVERWLTFKCNVQLTILRGLCLVGDISGALYEGNGDFEIGQCGSY